MIDFDLYSYELVEILEDMIRSEYPDAIKTQTGWNIKCPLCGNSKYHYKKGKGHFLIDHRRSRYTYYCFNAGECEAEGGIHISRFLRELHLDYHKEYMNRIFTMKKEDLQARKEASIKREKAILNVPRNLPKLPQAKFDISNVKEFVDRNRNELKHMKSIKDYSLAMEFCAKRQIPEVIYNKWLFVPDNKDPKCFTKDRIIIPFLNDKKQIYFYQARTIIGEEPKYKNSQSSAKAIFNYYEADFDKPVIIVEGPIDSLFIENSIATLGLKYDKEVIDNIPEKYFLFDYDKAGKAESLKLLEQGQYVFKWRQFLIDHNEDINTSKVDFNDLAIKFEIKQFKFKDLKKYFTNNILEKYLL